MDRIHESDPWIRSMVLFDLKREIDFLMSFKDFAELFFFCRASGDNFFALFLFDFLISFTDFAELSFFVRASRDNFLRSFFFYLWIHVKKMITAWRGKD